MQFLFISSWFTLYASSPRSVALTQLRFTLLTVTSSQRDLHPQVCDHVEHTRCAPMLGAQHKKTHSFRHGSNEPFQIQEAFLLYGLRTPDRQ
jgi:hypothetical protein